MGRGFGGGPWWVPPAAPEGAEELLVQVELPTTDLLPEALAEALSELPPVGSTVALSVKKRNRRPLRLAQSF